MQRGHVAYLYKVWQEIGSLEDGVAHACTSPWGRHQERSSAATKPAKCATSARC